MTPFTEALDYLKDDAPQYALMTLRTVMEYPSELSGQEQWKMGLELMSQVYRHKGLDTLADLYQKASAHLEEHEFHYQLGHSLIEIREPALAAGVLDQALQHHPRHVNILTELVAALELLGRYEDARKNLASNLIQDFFPQYLLAFETLMIGDLTESRNLYGKLIPTTKKEQYLKERLQRIFKRIDVIKGTGDLHPSQLRPWHLAVTGGLLLHLSEKEAGGIKGRYDNLEDSEALCLEGIKRFTAVMETWGTTIPRVLAFQNPDSMRLAHAFSKHLNVPLKEVLVPEEPGLFVAYDIEGIIPEVRLSLKAHQPGLIVFSNALKWTTEYTFTSDIVNSFYNTIVSPWNRHTIFPWRPELPSVPPTESDQELGQKILDSQLLPNALEDLPELLSLAEMSKEVAAALKKQGKRERSWHGFVKN